jgi:hypothetical protein
MHIGEENIEFVVPHLDEGGTDVPVGGNQDAVTVKSLEIDAVTDVSTDVCTEVSAAVTTIVLTDVSAAVANASRLEVLEQERATLQLRVDELTRMINTGVNPETRNPDTCILDTRNTDIRNVDILVNHESQVEYYLTICYQMFSCRLISNLHFLYHLLMPIKSRVYLFLYSI